VREALTLAFVSRHRRRRPRAARRPRPGRDLRNSVTAAVKERSRCSAAAQPTAAHGPAPQHVHERWEVRLPDAPLWRIHDWQGPRGLPVLAGLQRRPELRRRGRRAFLDVSQPVLPAAVALGMLPQPLDGLLSPAGDPGRERPRRHRGHPRHRATAVQRAPGTGSHRSPRIRRHRRLAWSRAPRRCSTRSAAPCSSARGSGRPGPAPGGVVEQLLVEGKRARDTEAAAMNMQLTAWRDRAAVNVAFVAGSGDALRVWRQP
jgi:hypothetical protein